MIRPLRDDDGPWKEASLRQAWGGVAIARKGELVDVLPLEGFVALDSGERCGLLTYLLRGEELEVVTLHVNNEGKGLARSLMDAGRAQAEMLGARRLWLVTTGNNARAVRFYQRWGMRLAAFYADGVAQSRLVKPSIPLVDGDGVPIRDELEFELMLGSDRTFP